MHFLGKCAICAVSMCDVVITHALDAVWNLTLSLLDGTAAFKHVRATARVACK